MAFTIKNIIGAKVETVYSKTVEAINNSRFTARVELHTNKVTIHKVRLRKPKHYCGNHPFACPVRPFEKPHKKLTFLEGADWVSFNDMINNILDKLGVSANVASSLVIIRKGLQRCSRYDGYTLGNGIDEWKRDSGEFINGIGKRIIAKHPEGTPGIYSFTGN